MNNKLLKTLGIPDDDKEYFNKIYATDPEYLGTNLQYRKIIDENGHISFCVIIPNKSKRNVFTPVIWDKIDKELEYIEKVQGADLPNYFQVILNYFYREDYQTLSNDFPEILISKNCKLKKIIKKKPEFRDIFMDINFDLLVFLIALNNPKTEDVKELAKSCVSNIITLFKISDNDLIDFISVSSKEINNNHCPWDIYSGYLEFERVKNQLQYLIKNYGNREYSDDAEKNFSKLYFHFLKNNYWEKAIKLLQKDFPETYNKYKPRFDTRVNKMIQHISEFIE